MIQRLQKDNESSEVFQMLRERGRSKKNKMLAMQLQAVADAPELAVRSDPSTSIRFVTQDPLAANVLYICTRI